MPDLLQMNRRKFLAQSSALTAASVFPLGSLAQETMITRTIPGTNKERPDFFLLGYSMFQHEAEERLLPLAADLGIAIIVSEAFKTTSDGGYFGDTAGRKLPEWTVARSVNAQTHV